MRRDFTQESETAKRFASNTFRKLGMERAPVINSDEQLLSVLATLEACRATLVASGNRETAQLVSVAILELRMKLGGIDDDDLKALCDEMVPHEDIAAERTTKSSPGHRRRPLLRVVK